MQVKDATLKKVKTLEEQKEAVETERDSLKVGGVQTGNLARPGQQPRPFGQNRTSAPVTSAGCCHMRRQHDGLLAAALQAAVASLERDVESEQHATTMEKKRLAELAHERDVLNKLRTQVCPTVALPCPATTHALAGCKVASHDLACGCVLTASSPELPHLFACCRLTLPPRSSRTWCA